MERQAYMEQVYNFQVVRPHCAKDTEQLGGRRSLELHASLHGRNSASRPAGRQTVLPASRFPACSTGLWAESTCFPEPVLILRAPGLNEAPDPLMLPRCLQAEVN